MTDDFAPSQHPAQAAAREQLIHERASALREKLDDVGAAAPDETEGMRLRLEHVGRKLLDVMAEVDAVTAVRNELVVEASEKYALPRSYVAQAAVLTRGRVQQLVAREREQRSCPVCGSEVPDPGTAHRVGTGGPGEVGWQPWVQTTICPGCGALLERMREHGPGHRWTRCDS